MTVTWYNCSKIKLSNSVPILKIAKIATNHQKGNKSPNLLQIAICGHTAFKMLFFSFSMDSLKLVFVLIHKLFCIERLDRELLDIWGEVELFRRPPSTQGRLNTEQGLLAQPFGEICDTWKKFFKLLIVFFCTRPPPGLLPVLGPLGSGTDATHLPSPALRLKGWCWSWVHY